MNTNPKISIIVPVYKAEKYLRTCINSILNQTFVEFEVLLINDGSPDKSGEICDEYALIDKRIKVFHKVNGGVSSARQCGLINTIGEYVIHVDPDDWIEPNMLTELYQKAIEDSSDMVICDYLVENHQEDSIKYIKQEPSTLDHNVVLKELFGHLHGSCCNKLVRRSCFEKFNVSYPLELSHCEDLYVNVLLLLNNIKITYLPKAYYHYIIGNNENSLTTFYNKNTYQHDLYKKEIFCTLFKNHVLMETCNDFFIYSLVKRAFIGSLFSSKEFEMYTKKYKNNILRNKQIPIIFRMFLYFSCIGYYKPSRFVYQQLIKLKKSIL